MLTSLRFPGSLLAASAMGCDRNSLVLRQCDPVIRRSDIPVATAWEHASRDKNVPPTDWDHVSEPRRNGHTLGHVGEPRSVRAARHRRRCKGLGGSGVEPQSRVGTCLGLRRTRHAAGLVDRLGVAATIAQAGGACEHAA
jgi:hypothetical protein